MKTYEIRISAQAETDLREVFEYIAYDLQSPQTAARQLSRLEERILGLEQLANLGAGMVRCSCHIGDELYLDYMGRSCPCVHTMRLPEDGSYTIRVLDAWEMTDTVVMTNVAGVVKVPTPGKELIAILAVRNEFAKNLSFSRKRQVFST